MTLQWNNGLWLLAPILIWNAVFASKLTHPAFAFDHAVSKRLLLVENVLRVVVMVLPLFLPLRWDTPLSQFGIVLYLMGLLTYGAAWLPLMGDSTSKWAASPMGFLAPAYTPWVWLAGIGLIGGWWPYLLLATIFCGVHIWHWKAAHQLWLASA